MAYTNLQGRQQLLDELAAAAAELGFALGCLTEAYERLDENAAERLEQELFRPVQAAYGRAKRTHAEFADRYELPHQTFESRAPGAPSNGAKGFLESAVEAVDGADRALATLQDSMLPIEVGDPELRAGLTDVREAVDGLRGRVRELVRTLGR